MLIESYKQMGYKAEATELTAEPLAPGNYGSVWAECDIVDESTYNARKPRRASYSAMQGIGGTAIGKVTGSFEPRPSGTNGTAPDWYAIAAAAGGTVDRQCHVWRGRRDQRDHRDHRDIQVSRWRL